MKYFGALGFAAILIVMVPICLDAQFVHGYVFDATDSTGIDSAHVEGACNDAQGHFMTCTDSVGSYYVAEDSMLPAGMWVVTASHPQYHAQKKEVHLPRKRCLNFYLAPRDTIK